ncbi:AMP-binding protein, partial [Xanthomonas citri pv. citri]
SYAVFDARIRKAAGWLAAQGIGAGDVVAVLMKNSAAFLELVFATSHLGAVFLPINFRLSRDEVGYITANAGARLLIVDEELAANAAGAKTILLDEAAQQSVTRLAGNTPPAPMQVRQPSDLMRLMYT